MSDPPPKKPGSLRDRIAAFENKGPVTPGPTPPAPRPKPGNLQWKPKLPSPPSSPPANTTNDDAFHPDRKHAGGMSASDARETIGTGGGSLKERMAALQGRGGFGPPQGAAISPPPRPASEKPKWKPPPVVPVVDADEPEEAGAAHPAHPAAASEASGEPHPESSEPAQSVDDEDKPADEDPEEEERQRRAAIAARIARLGGARVGMAPPVFGRKPDVKKKAKVEEAATVSGEPSHEAPSVKSLPSGVDEPAQSTDKPDATSPQEYFEGKDTAASDVTSPGSISSGSVRSPAMPVPSGPRRAVPPRKRVPKAPSPTVTSPSEEPKDDAIIFVTETTSPERVEEGILAENRKVPDNSLEGDQQPEKTTSQIEVLLENVDISLNDSSQAAEATTEHTHDADDDTHELSEQAEPDHPADEPPVAVVTDIQIATSEEAVSESIPADEVADELGRASAHLAPEREVEEEEEEDEIARRKRIAERLSNSGGINPFAAPPPAFAQVEAPVRKDSSESTRVLSPPTLHHEDHPQLVHAAEDVQEASAVESTGLEQEKEDLEEEEEHEGPSDSAQVDELSDDRDVAEAVEALNLTEEPDEETSVHRVPESLGVAEEADETREGHEAFQNPQRSLYGREDHEDEEHETHEAMDDRPMDEDENGPTDDYPGPPTHVGLQPTHVTLSPPDVSEDVDGHIEAETEFVPDTAIHAETGLSTPLSSPLNKRRSLPPPRSIPPVPLPSQLAVETGHADDTEFSQESPSEYDPALARAVDEEAEQGEGERDEASVAYNKEETYQAGSEELEVDQVEDEDEDEEWEEPPPPPPRAPSIKRASIDVGNASLPPPPPIPSAPPVPPSFSPLRQRPSSQSSQAVAALPPGRKSSLAVETDVEQEVFDDSDVDPIDPTFYSPQKSASSLSTPHKDLIPSPLASPPAEAPAELSVSPTLAPSKVETSSESTDVPEDEEDAESARRQTIAQRMARLGGIRFGIPPPLIRPQPPAPPPPAYQREEKQGQAAEPSGGLGEKEKEKEEKNDEREQQVEEKAEEEEDEFARKQRIAARIAGMGGMRFGMPPSSFPPPHAQVAEADQAAPLRSPPPVRSAPIPPPPPSSFPSPPSQVAEADQAAPLRSPPVRSAPIQIPPPPPPALPASEQEEEVEYRTLSTSDGERIEVEESEAEEISHTEAEEDREEEEEAPPPVPSRASRVVSTQNMSASTIMSQVPPVPRAFTRPPVPVVVPRPPPPPMPVAAQSLSQESHSDFVMVADPTSPEESAPPPPPRSSSRAPPSRFVPPPPPPPLAPAASSTAPLQESPDGQWEMPSIPSVDFGGHTDLSLSAQWSEDTTSYTPRPPERVVRRESSRAPAPVAEVQLSSDDLMVQWGRVGVQVCEVATTLFDRSKKAVVGDGTYLGFVSTVLREVPNASQPRPPDNWGYLIYAQTGPAVQRRTSEIMPGDLIVLEEAKLKGHKGLQTYHVTAGAPGDPCIGIVSDFEVKKSKVKVFQANRHVGQQSVESVSYRLDDLKSGSIKIFRVLEA